MLFLKQRTQPLIGIDISSTSVKLVEISSQASNYRVETYAVEPLPVNAVNEKNINDVDGVGKAIKRVVKKSGTRNKKCVLAVPSSAVISKTIRLPANLKESDIEEQLQIEADQYIPYKLEEVNLDFEVLGPSANNPETVDVLLVASRSENVEMRVGAAELAGLTPAVMEVESYATERAARVCIEQLPDEVTTDVVAVLDVGATMTSITVLENGALAYTREQPFGGKLLTEDIMRRYGLSYEEAGIAKKEGHLPENYASEVLEPFKENLAQQVHRFLQFYYAASDRDRVDHILLAGGCASIEGVDKVISSRLGASVSVANPFAKMSVSNRVNAQRLNNDAPALMIACGLSLRSFD